MQNKKTSLLLYLCTILITTLMLTNKVEAASPNIARMSGVDRYQTNLSIVKNGWTEASNVVITNGENYPDALCAAPLAKSKNAPIILTSKDKLNSSALEELVKLNASNAYIIGGTGAVNTNAENNLKSITKYLSITKVDTVSDIAFVNEDYHFPPSALATFEDSSTKLVPVKWNSKKVDTSKASSYKFEGTIPGYDGKVQLDLNVVEDTDSSNHNVGNGTNIACYKGYLYYSSAKDSNKLYKIKGDGTEVTKISDDSSENLTITGDHIYYRNLSDNSTLYRMNLDGTGKTKILNAFVITFVVADGYIFYSHLYNQNPHIYRTNLDGSNQVALCNDYSRSFNVMGNFVYYLNGNDNNSIYKMKIDRSEKTDVDFFKIKASAWGYLNVVFASPSIGSNAVVTLMDINGHTICTTKTRYDGLAVFSAKMKAGTACYIKLSSPHGELIESGLYEMAAWFTPLS